MQNLLQKPSHNSSTLMFSKPEFRKIGRKSLAETDDDDFLNYT